MLGISKDSVATQKRFADQYSLTFPLLADEKGEVIAAYGVAGLLGHAQRKTFLIDEAGRIAKVWEKVNPLTHAARVAEEIAKK